MKQILMNVSKEQPKPAEKTPQKDDKKPKQNHK
jgi:hypothetical protein